MASINGKTETLCIFGHPVAHSKSPAMHNALFDALGINAAYLPYAPEPENFAKAIEGFKAMKFRGANVTIPYKTEFFNADGSARLVDELSEISKFTGSVNTLYWKDGIVGGTLCGTTTDPYGCVRNLEENGVSPSNKKIALLGNGGAAKAIAYTLVEQQNNLTIVCRTQEKGQALADSLNQAFANKSTPVQVTTFGDFASVSANFDIIINATSVGMSPNVDESPLTEDSLHEGQVVCDIVYTPPRTKLLQMAETKGCKVVTGEGMLVHQGLESFKKWFPKETENKTNEELTAIMRKGMQG
ncbi:MAG: shikimate dehydrogenase [Fibrobacter sp.]|uniref:shikimate dehydrogenase n=1 Tax=Fibrobacter sp. TaxID=35828 RepID=UPI0025C5C149|nr:shikimate dehydrogenase [Fibrobacter sp.]MBQ7079706.1 shikimate dehydrogenase [Fibrobacter sp.]